MTDVLTFLREAQRCLPPRLSQWRNEVAAAALCTGMDPWTLCALIDRESLGGDALKPKGCAGKGDAGNGHGLAQIDGRYHAPFIAATFDGSPIPLWKDAAFCILYGAKLLAKNVRLLGSEVAALAAYNAGRQPVHAAFKALPPDATQADKVRAADSCTTHRNYVSDVLDRRARFLAKLPTS